MSEDYKVQVSGNFGEGLVVLRGNSAAELVQQAKDLAANFSALYDTLGEVKQIASVKEVFTAKKSFNSGGGKPAGGYQGNKGGSGGGSANDTAKDGPDGGKVCSHGAMKLLDYKKQDGTRVHGHYCQAPRNATDKCKAVTLPGHGDK